jgi:MoxR-like ATPase
MVGEAPPSGRRRIWPFVGRDHELAIFGTILADASCRGVLVCGPSGVGKTGLAEEFLLDR